MQKWEYVTLTAAYSSTDYLGYVKIFNDQEFEDWKKKKWDVVQALNDLGKEGWELVNVVWRPVELDRNIDPVYYFKRPLAE